MHHVIENSDHRFQQHWHTLLNNDPLRIPLYASLSARAVESARRSPNYTDRSFLVISENEPVIGCSLTLHVDKSGRKRLGYFGLDACTHVNQSSLDNASNNFCPEAIRLLQQHVDKLIVEEQPEAIDYFDPVSCGIMSPVTQVLLEKGAIPTVQQVQIIDLKMPLEQLRCQVHRDYLEHIAWGLENLDLRIVTGDSTQTTHGHRQQTLPVEVYDENDSLQSYIDLLNNGQGFVVQAEHRGGLVASALFVYSNRTCQFVFADLLSDGASLGLDKPVLYSVIWQAIVQAKTLGCSQFDFGAPQSSMGMFESHQLSPTHFGGLAHTRLKVSLQKSPEFSSSTQPN